MLILLDKKTIKVENAIL